MEEAQLDEIEALKARIASLEAENKRLKDRIEKLKSGKEGFYTLKSGLSSLVDLGEITEKLPPEIPEHKKWKASDYPKDWPPKQKAAHYLETFWKNYPVSRSYFSNVKGGQSFYKYISRNNLFELLPDSFQLEFKKRMG